MREDNTPNRQEMRPSRYPPKFMRPSGSRSTAGGQDAFALPPISAYPPARDPRFRLNHAITEGVRGTLPRRLRDRERSRTPSGSAMSRHVSSSPIASLPFPVSQPLETNVQAFNFKMTSTAPQHSPTSVPPYYQHPIQGTSFVGAPPSAPWASSMSGPPTPLGPSDLPFHVPVPSGAGNGRRMTPGATTPDQVQTENHAGGEVAYDARTDSSDEETSEIEYERGQSGEVSEEASSQEYMDAFDDDRNSVSTAAAQQDLSEQGLGGQVDDSWAATPTQRAMGSSTPSLLGFPEAHFHSLQATPTPKSHNFPPPNIPSLPKNKGDESVRGVDMRRVRDEDRGSRGSDDREEMAGVAATRMGAVEHSEYSADATGIEADAYAAAEATGTPTIADHIPSVPDSQPFATHIGAATRLDATIQATSSIVLSPDMTTETIRQTIESLSASVLTMTRTIELLSRSLLSTRT
ncbi:hypothetical protein NMY22_g14275 [Coprinellus aureogranulatus]|nr:hypothetical protein NMY22_g14275 [Coprinellus aureogranulatus]